MQWNTIQLKTMQCTTRMNKKTKKANKTLNLEKIKKI